MNWASGNCTGPVKTLVALPGQSTSWVVMGPRKTSEAVMYLPSSGFTLEKKFLRGGGVQWSYCGYGSHFGTERLNLRYCNELAQDQQYLICP